MPYFQRNLSPAVPAPLPASFRGPGMSPPAAMPSMMPAAPSQSGGGGMNPMGMMMQYMLWKKMMDQATEPLSQFPTGYEDAWMGPTGFGGASAGPFIDNQGGLLASFLGQGGWSGGLGLGY